MEKKIFNICLIVRIMFLASVMAFMKSGEAQAQESGQPQMPQDGFMMIDDERSVSIPFQEIDNHIVITVLLNGKLLNLVLDSGMPINGAALLGGSGIDSLKLNYSETMPVGGVGGEDILANVAMDAMLDLPNLKLTGQMLIVLPDNQSQHLRLEGRDGIIGFSIFENFVIEIDYYNHLLKLTKPEAYVYPEHAQKIPLEIRQNRIFIKGEIELETGKNIPAELVLDTGNRNALMVNTKSNSNLTIPLNNIPFDVYGLSAKLERKAGRIRNFKIGSFILPNVLAAFNEGNDGAAPPWEKEGNLGNGLLRRFDVTIDLSRKCMLLKPNRMFSAPFEFDMAGIQIERSADGIFIVDRVIPDSPAAKAGIQIGDKLLEIDGRPSEKWRKTDLNDYLKRSGETVRFKIESAGKFSEIKLTLARLI